VLVSLRATWSVFARRQCWQRTDAAATSAPAPQPMNATAGGL
jgi:hypothetical protein